MYVVNNKDKPLKLLCLYNNKLDYVKCYLGILTFWLPPKISLFLDNSSGFFSDIVDSSFIILVARV